MAEPFDCAQGRLWGTEFGTWATSRVEIFSIYGNVDSATSRPAGRVKELDEYGASGMLKV